jgi:hypothetical protein
MTIAATAPRRTATEPPPMMADVGAAPGAVLVVGKPAPVLDGAVVGLLLVVVLLLWEREPLLGAAADGVIRAELVVMVLLRDEVLFPEEVLLLPPTTGLYDRNG